MSSKQPITRELLLGDEAVAWGAMHAGVSAVYAYPGTPATEIMETLIAESETRGTFLASWCGNEKAAYEQALGVSCAGRRALVVMKHVGLNVAADPFLNSALVAIRGGLVLAVADDPGMHSSQNEQDSRYYADFARILCLEPATAQQAYSMTREAFELSERFGMPVMVRLVTRLSHGRETVEVGQERQPNFVDKSGKLQGWNLLPLHARRQWRALFDRQADLFGYSNDSQFNQLSLHSSELGVLTTGIAREYFLENRRDMERVPSHLHIGVLPPPLDQIRALLDAVDRVLILEEGYPIIERLVRGVTPPAGVEIRGKLSGEVPPTGELTPENARKALGLPLHDSMPAPDLAIPPRPPHLCAGCPHADAFQVIKEVFPFVENSLAAADIGCYTLGALPPYSAIESCVCMGASIGMAKGAAEAGLSPVVAVIGDGTFIHSGIPPLLDAISANAPITVIIMHNEAIAMTGGQPSPVPSSRMKPLLLGMGVAPEHLHVLRPQPRDNEMNSEILRKELGHEGLSVIVFARECVQTIRRRKRHEARQEG